MKQLYLLTSLLLLASATFSQHKFEFGFAVKAGTHNWPHREKYPPTVTETYPAGSSMAFGAYVAKRLNGRFALSAELLYNISTYCKRWYYFAAPPVSVSTYWLDSESHFEVQSMMLQAKIHFLLKKDGKTSLMAGFSPTHILGANSLSVFQNSSEDVYSYREKISIVRQNGNEGIHFLFNAGGCYRFSEHTAVGLEYTGLLSESDTNIVSYGPSSNGTNFKTDYKLWMKSLAISLHHNILR